MEEFFSSAVGFLSSADMYLIAGAAILTALIPIVRSTKNKTDDKVVDTGLSFLSKIRSYLPKKKVEEKVK